MLQVTRLTHLLIVTLCCIYFKADNKLGGNNVIYNSMYNSQKIINQKECFNLLKYSFWTEVFSKKDFKKQHYKTNTYVITIWLCYLSIIRCSQNLLYIRVTLPAYELWIFHIFTRVTNFLSHKNQFYTIIFCISILIDIFIWHISSYIILLLTFRKYLVVVEII